MAVVLAGMCAYDPEPELPPLRPLTEPTYDQTVTTTNPPDKGSHTTTGPEDIDLEDPGVRDAIEACAYGEVPNC